MDLSTKYHVINGNNIDFTLKVGTKNTGIILLQYICLVKNKFKFDSHKLGESVVYVQKINTRTVHVEFESNFLIILEIQYFIVIIVRKYIALILY